MLLCIENLCVHGFLGHGHGHVLFQRPARSVSLKSTLSMQPPLGR
jgi:hypothetical protein